MAGESRTGVGTGKAAAGTKTIAVAVAAAVTAAVTSFVMAAVAVVAVAAIPKISIAFDSLAPTVRHLALAGRAVESPTSPASRMAKATTLTTTMTNRRWHSQCHRRK